MLHYINIELDSTLPGAYLQMLHWNWLMHHKHLTYLQLENESGSSSLTGNFVHLKSLNTADQLQYP